MALTLHNFDQQSYTFEKPEQADLPICTDLNSLLNEVIGDGHGYNNDNNQGFQLLQGEEFNDLDFYTSLCDDDGCTHVDISHIDVFHSQNCFFGLRVYYRSAYYDGTTHECSIEHAFSSGYSRRTSMIIFERGEYLAEIRMHTSASQIIFITNKRAFSFGGNGGGEGMLDPPDLSRRVVAIVGTSKGRLGAISISRNWEEVRPLVLLRTLVERNRASLVLQDESSVGKVDAVVQWLIKDTDEDVFKRVASFLLMG